MCLLFILSLTLLLYSGAARGFFFQDDLAWLLISRFSSVPEYLQIFVQFDPVGTYRPLSVGTFFWLGQKAFGLWAPGYHIVSLLSHSAGILLLYVLLRSFFPALPSLAGTLFFAVHSSHFVSLYWISAFPEPLALGFYIASLLLFIRFDRENRRLSYALSLLCMGLGLMSKESILSLPLVLAAYCLMFSRSRWLWTSPYFGLAGAYGLLRLSSSYVKASLYPLVFGEETLRGLSAYISWAAGFSETILKTRMDLNPSVCYPIVGALFCMVTIFLVIGLRDKRPALFGLLWFFLALQPVLYFRQHAYAYYLACSLPGAALFIASILSGLGNPQRKWLQANVVLLGCAWIILCFASVSAEGDWWNRRANYRRDLIMRIREIDNQVPVNHTAYVFCSSPDEFEAFENGAALQLYVISPGKLNFVLLPVDTELRSRITEMQTSGAISSVHCFELSSGQILDKSIDFRRDPIPFLGQSTGSYIEVPGVRLVLSPHEARSGIDSLRLRVEGLEAHSIDVLYTIDGQLMPPVTDWRLDANESASVFISSSTRKGVYHYKAVRNSQGRDSKEWIKVDAEVIVR